MGELTVEQRGVDLDLGQVLAGLTAPQASVTMRLSASTGWTGSRSCRKVVDGQVEVRVAPMLGISQP